MKQQRFLGLIALCSALCVLLAACAPATQTGEENKVTGSVPVPGQTTTKAKPKRTLQLAFDLDDPLNPLKLQRVTNRQLISLLYDVPVATDLQFSPVASLAKSYEANGNVYHLTLKSGMKFWDGSPVTAKDVVASLLALRDAKSCLWAAQLKDVVSAKAIKTLEVEITLKEPNLLFGNCLDFPVMKQSTLSDPIPVGAGRFAAQQKSTLEPPTLTLNPHYRFSDKLANLTLELVAMPDSKAVLNAVKLGDVDLFYASAARYAGFQTGCSYQTCSARDLVFLGMNITKKPLDDAKLRQAIYLGVDRALSVTGGYSGFGQKAFFPVHPATVEFAAENYDTNTLTPAKGKALVQGLKEEESKLRPLTLMVQKGASHQIETGRLICGQLGKIGLEVTLEQVDKTAYLARVKKGDYDLYLGETLLPVSGDMTQFFNGTLTKGSQTCKETQAAWSAYLKGDGSLTAYLDAFANEVPFVPVLFVQHLALISRQIDFQLQPAQDNLFANIENW